MNGLEGKIHMVGFHLAMKEHQYKVSRIIYRISGVLFIHKNTISQTTVDMFQTAIQTIRLIQIIGVIRATQIITEEITRANVVADSEE